MTVESFMFRNKFKDTLTDEEIQLAINCIEADWSGVSTMWRVLPAQQREMKINLTMNYLVAWWLADYEPSLVTGVFTTGGVPLIEKEIGGVEQPADAGYAGHAGGCWRSRCYPSTRELHHSAI